MDDQRIAVGTRTMLEDVGDAAHVCAQSETRLGKLERRVRVLLVLVVVLIIALVSSWLANRKPESVLSAQGFILTDADGQGRGAFGFGASGQPVLALYDRNGAARISMSITREGYPSITTYDDEKADGVVGFAPVEMAKNWPGNESAAGSSEDAETQPASSGS
jgi:hypothetical protein